MRKDFSPEERLLRLIKGSKKKDTPKESSPDEKVQFPAAAPQARGILARHEKSAVKAATASVPLAFRLKGLNTRAFNSALIAVLVIILVYFVYDILYTSYRKKEPDIFAENGKAARIDEKEEPLDIQPYSFYSSAIEGRDIFLPQQVEAGPVVTGPGLDEIRSGLSLIGIIAGKRPQAIIEEKKSGKSYFLYKGGTVGKIKVVDVLEGSVIMDYQGEKFELVL